MATTIKSRFPLLLLLGIIFLASVCVTYANYDEGTEPRVPGKRERGRQEGEKEEKHHGELRPSYEKQEDEEEEHRYHYHREKTGQRERGRQEGEKEDKHHGEWIPPYEKEEYEKKEQKKTQPGRERWDREQDEEEVEESRGSQRTEPRVPGQRERGRQEGEKEEKRHGEWIPSYGKEEDEEEKHRYHPEKTGQRERGRQEGEKEDKHHGEWIPSYEKEEYEKKEQKKTQPGRERWDREEDEKEVEQSRGSQPTEPRVPGQRERGRQEGEKEEKRHGEWIPSYGKEEDEEEKHRYHPEKTGQRERGRQEGEKEEKRRGEWISSYENEEDEEEKKYPYHYHPEKKEQKEAQPGSERWEKVEDEEQVEEQWRGSQRHEDPDERARERYRREIAKREVEEEREERDKHHQHEGSSKSQEQRNPFLFKSNKFLTLYENENGYIRRIQRFDERSDIFENLQNYRLVEYRAKPHTIFLPQHIDADLILTVLSGKAILTVLSPNDRNSYNLERGDIIKIPAGTTSYIVNQDDEEDLRVVDLVISVNRPGKFEAFDLSKNKNQYLRGFSKNILEASLNTKYETIERVLLGERRQQGQEIDAIVKVSREQIVELRKLAKSSLRKILPSEFEPLNLRSQNPIYSNKFGKFFEITPEKKHPQLQDLDIFVSSVEINEGALFLPHYNSRAIVVLFVNEGRGNLELVGFKNEQQERREREDEQQERNNQVQRYEARLSPGDVVIIPSGHPVAVSASSNLNLLGFGINAENNQRNFLTGSEDNVISQIENPVKEVTFPGSAQEVNRLLKNQEHSHFANAEPEQKEEESQGKSSLLSSILKTYY